MRERRIIRKTTLLTGSEEKRLLKAVKEEKKTNPEVDNESDYIRYKIFN